MPCLCVFPIHSFSCSGTITDTEAAKIVNEDQRGEASVVDVAKRRLQAEHKHLKEWCREYVKCFMVDTAVALGIIGGTTGSFLPSMEGLRKAWVSVCNGNNRDQVDDFYTVLFGQFRRPIASVLKPCALSTVLSSLLDNDAKKAGITALDLKSMSLIDCIAQRYQLTNFKLPFAYAQAYTETIEVCSMQEQGGTPVAIHQIPQFQRRDQGYVYQTVVRARRDVTNIFFRRLQHRISVSIQGLSCVLVL